MDERIVKYQEKMDKTLANLDSEFGTIRAGRANPHVLDRIMVEYYGAPTSTAAGNNDLCTLEPDDPGFSRGKDLW